MMSKSTYLILANAFTKQENKLLFFSLGVILTLPTAFGIATWTPPWLLNLATGVGAGLNIAVISASFLACGILLCGNYGYGKGQALYFFLDEWARQKLAQATCSLAGINTGMLALWAWLDEPAALKTALLCLVLTSNLLWNWAGLSVCRDELNKRFGCRPA